MDIIVTMAGHSRRFAAKGYQGPKALLPIDGRPMIAHVVEMFDTRQDTFHIVANSAQVKENPDLPKILRALAADVNVVIIDEHEKGPTYSALQVRDVSDDEEVIVTYCDFIVDWDYARFLREVKGSGGAVPVFRGFHPASLGDTYYAYLRTDGKEMLELREKKSFTDNRAEEPASAGIYYFGNFGLLKKYGEEILSSAKSDSEAYTSLLFNPLVRDGHRVLIHDVRRFICWGTPEDLEQYMFWASVFKNPIPAPIEVEKDQANLIPMAGQGSRFRKEGYRTAKPLIQILGEPMAIAAAKSFPAADRWIFLPRAEDLRKHPIERTLRSFSPDCAVIPVDGDTSGQAATCLLAKKEFNPESPLFIASCDYQTRFDAEAWSRLVADESIDGAVWTFRTGINPTQNPNAFAYCELEPDGQTIKRVVEKQTISDNPGSDPMVVGSFWYRRAEDFVLGAESMIEAGITVNGEHYVGTSINGLIERGKRFAIFDIDQWISFGNPLELRIFEYWEEYFFQKSTVRGRA